MADQRDAGVGNLLGPDDVQRVLQRAAAIDARAADLVSEDQLRAVAAEAGISRAALDAALRELGEGTTALATADSVPAAASARASSSGLRDTARSWGRGRLGMVVAGAIGASALILVVMAWLIPGLLQHTAR